VASTGDVVATQDLGRLAAEFRDIGDALLTTTQESALAAIAHMVVERLDAAEWASVTRFADGQFATVASTDQRATQADALQYAIGSGPCVDAIIRDAVYDPADLLHDERWPEFGRRVTHDLGVQSMLSYRLLDETEDDGIHGLNIYSRRRNSFDEQDVLLGLMIATHGAVAVQSAVSARRVQNLQRALRSNRDIGTAIGVLMGQHHISRTEAFDLLRMASQNSNRRLYEIALEVVETGQLPSLGREDEGRKPSSEV